MKRLLALIALSPVMVSCGALNVETSSEIRRRAEQEALLCQQTMAVYGLLPPSQKSSDIARDVCSRVTSEPPPPPPRSTDPGIDLTDKYRYQRRAQPVLD